VCGARAAGAALVLSGGRLQARLPDAPRELHIATRDGALLKRFPLPDGAPVRLLEWPARQALLVAAAAELWDIGLDPQAEDRYDGLVHDFRFGEGVPVPGFLHRRRIPLAGPVQGWAVDAAGTLLVLVIAQPGGVPLLQGWNLDARRMAARWPWPPGATPGADPVIDEAAGVLWLPDGASPQRHRLPPAGGR
jgi:hypothetical protein